MKVVVLIDGREAVPVRAIPWLTNWETMSPDLVARALSWDEDAIGFEGLQAFQLDAARKAVSATWWENIVARELKALSHSIKATELTHETGLQEWRQKSMELLPAGVFVWKDEFEPMHYRRYGPDGTTLMRNGVQLTEEEHERAVTLDFEPLIRDLKMQRMVMEGFEQATEISDGESGLRRGDRTVRAINYIEAHAAEVLGVPLPIDRKDYLYLKAYKEGDPKGMAAAEVLTTTSAIRFALNPRQDDPDHPTHETMVNLLEQVTHEARRLAALMPEGREALLLEIESLAPDPKPEQETKNNKVSTLKLTAAPGATTTRHRQTRRDLLAPLIEVAQREVKDPFDAAAMFASLRAMAEKATTPFVGVSDEGIKWMDTNDNPQFLTIKNLRDRLARSRKRARQDAK